VTDTPWWQLFYNLNARLVLFKQFITTNRCHLQQLRHSKNKRICSWTSYFRMQYNLWHHIYSPNTQSYVQAWIRTFCRVPEQVAWWEREAWTVMSTCHVSRPRGLTAGSQTGESPYGNLGLEEKWTLYNKCAQTHVKCTFSIKNKTEVFFNHTQCARERIYQWFTARFHFTIRRPYIDVLIQN